MGRESLVKVRKSDELLGKIEASEGRHAGDTKRRRHQANFSKILSNN